jgi:hypothetical protein
MGKTFRRDKPFRPKKQGRVFTKDRPWKKSKRLDNRPPSVDLPPDIILPEKDLINL